MLIVKPFTGSTCCSDCKPAVSDPGTQRGYTKMISIRQAEVTDLPRILELYEQLTEEKIDLAEDAARKIFAEISEIPRQHFPVAEKDGLVVGTLFLQIVPNLTHNGHPWAIIENMVVDSACRRQGIGRRLIEYAFSRCRQACCYKVQLLSNKKRLEAHQFYRAMGFEDSAMGFRIYF
jgi:N-acetylglutamate synthase-like GNAT family acetyltransferase